MTQKELETLFKIKRFGKYQVFIKDHKLEDDRGRVIHGNIFENRNGRIIYAGKLLTYPKGRYLIIHKKPYFSTNIPFKGKFYGPISYGQEVPEAIKNVLLAIFRAPKEKLEETVEKATTNYFY